MERRAPLGRKRVVDHHAAVGGASRDETQQCRGGERCLADRESGVNPPRRGDRRRDHHRDDTGSGQSHPEEWRTGGGRSFELRGRCHRDTGIIHDPPRRRARTRLSVNIGPRGTQQMSRIAYLECASGAAGDMLLAASIDLGFPIEVLRGELAKLPLKGYRIETAETRRCGLRALKLDVVDDEPPRGARHLSSILELIRSSELADPHKARATSLFERLGEAEASVHGTPVEKVHFHEVGAVDSIVDIVGAVIAMSWLDVDRVSASPLNVGTGSVTTEHGQMPVSCAGHRPAASRRAVLRGGRG